MSMWGRPAFSPVLRDSRRRPRKKCPSGSGVRRSSSKQLNLERKRKAAEAQIAAIRAGFETEEAEVSQIVAEEKLLQQAMERDRKAMAKKRKAD
jgi:hypothetical protein